jgi:hypothetical protein
MSKELIVIEETNLPQLFTANGCDPLIERIKAEVSGHVPDVSTVGSRKDIASLAYKVSQSKTVIENAGKEFVSKIKDQTKAIDAERKRVREELDMLRDEVRKPLTDWELAEEKRLAAEKLAAEKEADHESAIGENDLFDRQREIERKEALFAKQEKERIEKEIAAQAELDRIEAERQADIARVARDKRLADEAIEAANREADEKIAEEQRKTEQAKRDLIAAEERAKLEKEQAEESRKQAIVEAERKAKEIAEMLEISRVAAEQKEKNRVDLLAANKNHQKKVNRQMVADFGANDIDEATAKNIIKLVVSGKIQGMTVNY